MNLKELRKIAARGEDSHIQFKLDIRSPEGLASEVVAMRVRKLCPDVKFLDDKDGVQFKAILPRRSDSVAVVDAAIEGSLKGSLKSSLKSSLKILEALGMEPTCTYDELSEKLGISRRAITKQIKKLRDAGKLRRVGPDKGGYWEVVADRGR